MSREEILVELDALINEGQEVLSTEWEGEVYSFVDEALYDSWRIKSLGFLKSFILEEELIKPFKERKDSDCENTKLLIKILSNIKDYIIKEHIIIQEDGIDMDNVFMNIFSRFHRVARQLRSRHNGRSTLEIEDEYDVQDLLHALLQLHFDDIRAEEWTPSYAGKSARVDFLLKKEKIVIEVKKQGRD